MGRGGAVEQRESGRAGGSARERGRGREGLRSEEVKGVGRKVAREGRSSGREGML